MEFSFSSSSTNIVWKLVQIDINTNGTHPCHQCIVLCLKGCQYISATQHISACWGSSANASILCRKPTMSTQWMNTSRRLTKNSAKKLVSVVYILYYGGQKLVIVKAYWQKLKRNLGFNIVQEWYLVQSSISRGQDYFLLGEHHWLLNWLYVRFCIVCPKTQVPFCLTVIKFFDF